MFGLVDGRLLEANDWGDADGWPVLLCHGTPGSVSWTPSPAGLAYGRQRGVRLITASRPGYGRSSRQVGRSVGDWASDADQLMGHLLVGAGGVGVIGVSGGGPHALACGARTSNVVAVAVLAGGGDLAHSAACDGMAPASTALWRSAFEPDGALEQVVRRIGQRMAEGDAATVAARVLAGFPSSAVTFLEENPAAREVMIEDLVEAFAGGGWGWLDDARAFASAWGFELSSVRVPVRLWHGAADEFVPVQQAQRLAGELPDATLSIRRNSGHMDLIADEFNNAIDWLVRHRH